MAFRHAAATPDCVFSYYAGFTPVTPLAMLRAARPRQMPGWLLPA
jgi:hypothetical protein